MLSHKTLCVIMSWPRHSHYIDCSLVLISGTHIWYSYLVLILETSFIKVLGGKSVEVDKKTLKIPKLFVLIKHFQGIHLK